MPVLSVKQKLGKLLFSSRNNELLFVGKFSRPNQKAKTNLVDLSIME